jgi:hypothetical protein
MKMPPDILTFLLRCGHLNVEERKAKGFWTNESLRYSDVLDHLAGLIQTEEWFPRMMPEHQQGNLVYVRTVVQRISPSQFVCRSRRPSVFDLRAVAEESHKEFRSAREAAEFYLKWELNLPGRLDSWSVE